jgi:hypothetical protein
MPESLPLHFDLIEKMAQRQKRRNQRGLPVGNGWYAKRNSEHTGWEIGLYENKYGLNLSGAWVSRPFEEWKFVPHYFITPGRISWDPNNCQIPRLRVYTQSNTRRAISSPIHTFCFALDKSVQGEGLITLHHTDEGYPTKAFTTNLPLKKIWDKEKYLELRRKRMKAERILRAVCKMGGMDAVSGGTKNLKVSSYLELLDQLVKDDSTPNEETMAQLADAVRRTIRDRTHTRWVRDPNGNYTTSLISPTTEEAFQIIRDELREASYKLTKTYTYEPFDDGRHITRFT